MNLVVWIICLTICIVHGDRQEDLEAVVLQKDLQEYFRRLSQQPPVQTTHNFRTAFLPENTPSLGQQSEDPVEELVYPFPSLKGPFQSNSNRESHSFAASSASIKRPNNDGEANAKAMAFSSLKDVDAEEHIGENIDSPDKSSTTFSDMYRTSSAQDEAVGTSPKKGDPYTLKQQQVETVIRKEDESFSDVYFVAIVAGCCAVGIFGVISAGICFYRLQKSQKAAADVDYPAYGVTGPCKDVTSPNGDRKLAQSAQMYHFQLQKQQMIAVEKAGSTKNTSASDVDSEEENEEGDYTVYECPGLAPTGEMEVKNPLFHDDSTPVSPPMLPDKTDGPHQHN
ncbi:uncharacterized protein [Parasteatoda tepidariorum]|uniref:uncharacterized protein isoform X2 n=1 Tax=Parasteatoda tepidariorum TaxID=114398 RepID=UPI00077F9426|nr:uncharacterized protein LOC107448048 isoform X2 [Parasteatoda tepidariorum]